mmetsp:Transcript_35426/g.114667  ORF Transcript_35426/g.114667 Transcript_35426/m.114667 type:complete len:117 (+) Transcript_35426:688-1038(+)
MMKMLVSTPLQLPVPLSLLSPAAPMMLVAIPQPTTAPTLLLMLVPLPLSPELTPTCVQPLMLKSLRFLSKLIPTQRQLLLPVPSILMVTTTMYLIAVATTAPLDILRQWGKITWWS